MHSVAFHDVGALFEATLFEECLKPLQKDFDSLGSYGIDLLAQTIAQRDGRGFSAVLTAKLSDRG